MITPLLILNGIVVMSDLNNAPVPKPQAPYKFGIDCARDKPCEIPILLSSALEMTTVNPLFQLTLTLG